jgi:hypothetical protein
MRSRVYPGVAQSSSIQTRTVKPGEVREGEAPSRRPPLRSMIWREARFLLVAGDQEAQLTAHSLYRVPCGGTLVGAEVVEDDHLPRMQARSHGALGKHVGRT